MKCFRGALAAAVLAGGMLSAVAQDPPKPASPAKQQGQPPTADSAKDNKPDRELMAQIRKAVMDDKTLSMQAHNVKIIARNGKITLKGAVDSDVEKQTIEQKANEIAGAGNVTNSITVKAGGAKKTS